MAVKSDEENIYFYMISNTNRIQATITNYGARVVSIIVKDRNGINRDIVLGYDSIADYQKHNNYFGAVIGRNCNRIKNGLVTINGIQYRMEKNDGENNLHSGSNGLHNSVWDVVCHTANSVELQVISDDMSQGLPGSININIKYTITETNKLIMEYSGQSDKATIMNITNHTYFNLGGHENGTVLKHMVQILAGKYTPIDAQLIPTGIIESISDSPLDFRHIKMIGKDIDSEYEQLKFGNGYDHNYVLSKEGEIQHIRRYSDEGYNAYVYCEQTGIYMMIKTDCVGIQFYTGNSIDSHIGKNGAVYGKWHGFCMEPQSFPDALNHSGFGNSIIQSSKVYSHKTEYGFGIANMP